MGYLKNELSEKNCYHLSKHRYLELKHFCLQYPEWKQRLKELNGLGSCGSRLIFGGDVEWSDGTAKVAIERAELSKKIELVERIAREADTFLGPYILLCVTEGRTFPQMKALMDIPCGKNMFYDRYRKFFWMLGKER